MFCKKSVLKNLQNLKENICARVPFLIKACNFIKKETLVQVFSFEFYEHLFLWILRILKNTSVGCFYKRQSWVTLLWMIMVIPSIVQLESSIIYKFSFLPLKAFWLILKYPENKQIAPCELNPDKQWLNNFFCVFL